MATTRRSAQVDEEFLHQLYRGGELLAAGKVIEAKDYLEKAHKLQPKNEKGQNLLGLTYFKLGLFDRAAEIYELLVQENPADHTLRVNLGLVYLKANALQRAIREFETATDLAPEHKKAQNYLGLALAQAGEYGRAKEHFVLAGSEAMAEKMDRAMAGEQVLQPIASPAQKRGFAEIEGSEVVAERGGQVVEAAPPSVNSDWGAVAAQSSGVPAPVEPPRAAPPPPSQDEEMKFAEDEGPSATPENLAPKPKAPKPAPPPPAEEETMAEVSWGDEEAPATAAAETPVIEVGMAEEAPAPARKVEAPPPARVEEPKKPMAAMAPRAPSEGAAQLEALAPTMQAFSLPLSDAFQLTPEGAVAAVNGELLVRLAGCVAILGAVTFTPEKKRYRGRPSDKSFGEGELQFVRASGQGGVLLAKGKQRFQVVDLGDDSAYFREGVVAAFEEPLMFENGRVPSESGQHLDLVHLRGTGKALIQIDGELKSVAVKMGNPALVPLDRLVGWVGSITPRLSTLWNDPKAPLAVELSGEGFAFCAV